MAASYQTTIKNALKDGGLLDALLAVQKRDGYVSEAGLQALADHVGKSAAELYDTASFYSMLRFTPPAKREIRVCRGTACHSADNAALVAALEKVTGLKFGESNTEYSLDYVDCLGQCQDAPNLLINGKRYKKVDASKILELLGGDK